MTVNLLQKLCGKLTDHNPRECWAYYEGDKGNEYYCRCKVCRYHFWTDKKPKKVPERRD